MEINTNAMLPAAAALSVSSSRTGVGGFEARLRTASLMESEAAAVKRQATDKQSAAEKRAAQAAEHDSAASALKEYLDKSPAEHLREAVMKELGLTEEDLAAMTPEKRMEAEAKIAERIKERLMGKEEGAADENASFVVKTDPSPEQRAAQSAQGSRSQWADPVIASLRASLHLG